MYFYFPQCFPPSTLQPTETYFSKDGTMVNYDPMLNFIYTKMIPQIKQKLNLDYFQWTKLRISDNNNSTDAAVFHRDVIHYPKKNDERDQNTLEIYTCLCYLDEGYMQLIPNNLNYSSNYKNGWKNITTLHIQPGSILIFPANMIHRGIFKKKSCHRRLIQLFDCFFSEKKFVEVSPQILHIPAQKNEQQKGEHYSNILKNRKSIGDFLNYSSFQLSYSGYNQKTIRKWLDKKGYSNIYFLSSEATQSRFYLKGSGFLESKEAYPSNRYIIPPWTKDKICLDTNLHSELKQKQYVQPLVWFMLMRILTPLFIMIVVLIVVISFSRSFLTTGTNLSKNKTKPKPR